jgi:hypothetical protein
METEYKESIAGNKKDHKRIILIGLLILLVAIAITFIVISIVQKNKADRIKQAEQEVRDYLEGAILIDRNDVNNDQWDVYSFKNNQVSVENWYRDETAPVGDLTYYQSYEVIIEDGFGAVIIHFADVWLRLKWNDRGNLMEPIHDRLATYREGEIDIEQERNDFFCEHDFAIKVIKQATCTSAGEEQHTCKKCGQQKTAYPEAEHKFESHKCTICGDLEKSSLKANTWYSHKVVTVLHSQNCLITNATTSGNAVIATYYMVCAHCHGIDDWLQMSGPEIGYQVSKLHTCDECGKTTTVKLKVE